MADSSLTPVLRAILEGLLRAGTQDPNEDSTILVRTRHANAPTSDEDWFIFTLKGEESQEQLALSADATLTRVFFRSTVEGVYGDWADITNSGMDIDADRITTGVLSEERIPTLTQEKIEGLAQALTALTEGKVSVEEGKGLSETSFTQEEKDKLSALESSRFKGTYVSVDALVDAQPSPEVGSYANVDEGEGSDVRRAIWDESDGQWVVQEGPAPDLTPAQVKQLYEDNPGTEVFTPELLEKLGAIAIGATANASDAELRDRGQHTGTQPIESVEGLQDVLDQGMQGLNNLSGTVGDIGLALDLINGVEAEGGEPQ